MSESGVHHLAPPVPVAPDDVMLLPAPDQELQLTPDSRSYLDRWMATQRHGPLNGWTMCEGIECPYYKKCPLARAGAELPRGKDCPVEMDLVRRWAEDKVAELGITSNIESTTLTLIRSLSWVLLEEWRLQVLISDETYIIDSFRFMDPHGNAINEPKVNPLHLKLEKVQREKASLLKQLMATPEMKAKDRRADKRTVADLLLAVGDKMSKAKHLLEESERPDYIQLDAEKSGRLLLEEDVIDVEVEESPIPKAPDLQENPPPQE